MIYYLVLLVKGVIIFYGCRLLYNHIYYAGFSDGFRARIHLTPNLIRNGDLPGFSLYYPGAGDNIRMHFRLDKDGVLEGQHHRLMEPDKITRFTCDYVDDNLIERVFRSYEQKGSQ